jgi:hypothetical protein
MHKLKSRENGFERQIEQSVRLLSHFHLLILFREGLNN